MRSLLTVRQAWLVSTLLVVAPGLAGQSDEAVYWKLAQERLAEDTAHTFVVRTAPDASRFDRFISGDLHVLNPQERAGLAKFLTQGCTFCHDGPALGGTRRATFTGIASPHPVGTRLPVPSLRGVGEHASFFHTGAVSDLPTAVRAMGAAQLRSELSAEDIDDIAAFLLTLTAPSPSSTEAAKDSP